MPDGAYAAASAMFTEQFAMDTVAENLANASSAGFKQSRLQRIGFAELLKAQGGRPGDDGTGIAATGTWRDFSQAELQQTHAPLDIGLIGEGFFMLREVGGDPLLSRNGHFQLDDEGRLVTSQGHAVQGQGGDIVIPNEVARVIVDEAGRIYGEVRQPGTVEQIFIDQLRVVTPGSERFQELVPRSGQVFDPQGLPLADAVGYQARQGFVEGSNVDPVGELVRMVALQRRYDAAQKALSRQLQSSSFSDVLRGG